jgi:hypothetical protein
LESGEWGVLSSKEGSSLCIRSKRGDVCQIDNERW